MFVTDWKLGKTLVRRNHLPLGSIELNFAQRPLDRRFPHACGAHDHLIVRRLDSYS